MSPTQHTSAATAELATKTTNTLEQELAAQRAHAHAHAILSTKSGNGATYSEAERALELATTHSEPRTIHVQRAIALATLAE